jgi:hypothetical protein
MQGTGEKQTTPPAASEGSGFRSSRAHAAGRPWPVRVLAVLSSVRMAAVWIALVALVTGLGTVYERDYGREAVAVMVYQAWWFKALFAALAINIFGAAAVRYPWREHQYGFVAVHAGLLMLIAGFAQSGNRLDGMLLINTHEPSSQIQLPEDYLAVLDGERLREVRFEPLRFAGYPSFARFCLRPLWPYEMPLMHACEPPIELVRGDKDSARVRVTRVVDTARPAAAYVARHGGAPALKVELSARVPTMPSGGLMPLGSRWLDLGDNGIFSSGPATVCLAKTNDTRLVEDFLAAEPSTAAGGTLFIYWKNQRREFAIDPAKLPVAIELAADCTVMIDQMIVRPAFDEGGYREEEQAAVDPFVVVRYALGTEETKQWHSFPVFAYYPCSVAAQAGAGGPEFLYHHPALHKPDGTEKGASFQALIGPDRSLQARWFSRSKGLLGTARNITTWNQTIVGGANSPMQIDAALSYLAEAEVGPEPVAMQPSQKAKAERWLELEVTRGGKSESTWIERRARKSVAPLAGHDVLLHYDHAQYDLMHAHGFSVQLERFEQGKDPGGATASFSSDVIITERDGKTWKALITMNEPLTVHGVSLYQSSFGMERDKNGEPTGEYFSVLTAATDPGRWSKYIGSTVLVCGIILLYALRQQRASRPRAANSENNP